MIRMSKLLFFCFSRKKIYQQNTNSLVIIVQINERETMHGFSHKTVSVSSNEKDETLNQTINNFKNSSSSYWKFKKIRENNNHFDFKSNNEG